MSEKTLRRSFIRTAGASAVGLAFVETAQAAKTLEEKRKSKVLKPKDPANLTAGEKKHTPVVTIKQQEDDLAEIQVVVQHVMQDKHWIEFIELLDAENPDKVLARKEMSPSIAKAEARFVVAKKKVGKFVVREYCNLHGLWESDGKTG